MAAPLGNQNATKETRLWGNAIKRAVAQNDGAVLRKLADRLIERAAEGDVSALKELGDRLDGKAIQQIDAKVDANVNVQVLRFTDAPPLPDELNADNQAT